MTITTDISISAAVRTPSVTVVIPAYNRAATVRRAVESVLAQTCQAFEIIIVDDASTDGTAAAVGAIADDRIVLIRHERNLGGGAARNSGIRAGRAPFIAFLDSDDEWLPRKLERQLEVFERSGGTLGLVCTGDEEVAADGSTSRFIPTHRHDLAKTLLLKNVIGGSSVGMVCRTVLDEVGGFDESLTSRQDVDLWLRILERFSIDFVPEALVKRFAADDDSRISANAGSTVKGWELFCAKHRDKLVEAGMLHRYLREIGVLYHRRARNPIVARRFYLESIAVRPVAPLAYGLLLTTFLPTSLLVGMATLSHRAAIGLRSAWRQRHARPRRPAASLLELKR